MKKLLLVLAMAGLVALPGIAAGQQSLALHQARVDTSAAT